MENKNWFGKNITALLLAIALLLPAAVQFAHAFDEHKHEVCSDQTTHLHETISKCGICDFHLATYNYTISEYPDFIMAVLPSEKNQSLYSELFYIFTITNTQLRAPPFFLVK
ncbi:hypothetical protein [Aequorivita echinoideorum]|uniref:DUF2752 domain-containing protein n=1 Tax=Aequorivita echinoideorum TaxID=1549647 RepID=A0ABS5S5W7_9FLAO|nr:hypothetical protein [Aequorivita echinoideorum]MBT0608373.1 hypothetical protein [Aequorivita echinoideorum]